MSAFHLYSVWANIHTLLQANVPDLVGDKVFATADFDDVMPETGSTEVVLGVGLGDSGQETEIDRDELECELERAGLSDSVLEGYRYIPTEFIIVGKHWVPYESGVDPATWITRQTIHEAPVMNVLNSNRTLGDATKHLGFDISTVERVDPIGMTKQNGFIENRFAIILSVRVLIER